MFVCPTCRGALRREPDALHCDACAKTYPIEHGIADFAGGAYYDHFDGRAESLSAEHRAGLACEELGAKWRIEEFYAPRIPPHARVLDCGCGNGLSVDTLAALGHDAWGIDLSALRKWQWRERAARDRLAVASALALPFPDASFDVVLSSGVIEHIGVSETGGATYTVTPLPERDELRRTFLAELLRVTRKSVFLDCPNGAFPIDFWHGAVGGRARFHSLSEGFLPTIADIRRLAGEGVSVRAISPRRRFAFRQVGRHWYGRALRMPVETLFRALELPLVRRAMPWMVPYLVVEIRRHAY